MRTFRIPADESMGQQVSRMMGPSERDTVEVDDHGVRVRIGDPPFFSVDISRASIRKSERIPDRKRMSRGAHGAFGRWLVNRSNSNLVRLTLRPPARAQLTLPDLGRDGPRWLR